MLTLRFNDWVVTHLYKKVASSSIKQKWISSASLWQLKNSYIKQNITVKTYPVKGLGKTLEIFTLCSLLWRKYDYSFNTYGQYPEKLTFLNPWYIHAGVRIRG